MNASSRGENMPRGGRFLLIDISEPTQNLTSPMITGHSQCFTPVMATGAIG
jgi:hypothetical protein